MLILLLLIGMGGEMLSESEERVILFTKLLFGLNNAQAEDMRNNLRLKKMIQDGMLISK